VVQSASSFQRKLGKRAAQTQVVTLSVEPLCHSAGPVYEHLACLQFDLDGESHLRACYCFTQIENLTMYEQGRRGFTNQNGPIKLF
jgi:hypothetical protein